MFRFLETSAVMLFFMHSKLFRFVRLLVELLLEYRTCKCGGRTVRGCQHIEQTARESREKTICIGFMLILEEFVSFDVKQNTPNDLSPSHTHTHTHAQFQFIYEDECEYI